MKTLNLFALASVPCFAANGLTQTPGSAKQSQSNLLKSQAVITAPARTQAERRVPMAILPVQAAPALTKPAVASSMKVQVVQPAPARTAMAMRATTKAPVAQAAPALKRSVPVVAMNVRAVQPAPAASSTSDIARNTALTGALVALHASFINQDAEALAGMVSPNGTVALYADGKFQATLESADFLQMMDGYRQAAQTSSLQISSIQMQGAQATVRLTHQFVDSEMNQVTIYQTYLLQRTGPSYTITAFMAASTPS
jgi:hypothetical protein